MGNKDGIVKAWAIRRRPLEERWDNAMVMSIKAIPSGWSTEDSVEYVTPIVTEDDGEPPSEEEEEERYSHEVRLRNYDFKRHGLTYECPGCIRIRRGQNHRTGTMRYAKSECMTSYSAKSQIGGGATWSEDTW